MRALLLGVRGSTASWGPEHLEVGGGTSCVAIPTPAGRWLVLDAGSGFTRLGKELRGSPFAGSIVLTHLHWDHTHGLPFLPNADRPDAEVDLWIPVQRDDAPTDPAVLLARSMSPPHFPIRPDQLRGAWTFRGLEPGEHEIEGIAVSVAEVHHKGGTTFGFRVDGRSGSLGYVPDHSPRCARPAARTKAIELVRGVDVLLHGGGYRRGEQEIADAFGHATVEDAIELAIDADVGRLVLVHHSPSRTDAQVAEIEREAQHRSLPFSIGAGREGDWIAVGADRNRFVQLHDSD